MVEKYGKDLAGTDENVRGNDWISTWVKNQNNYRIFSAVLPEMKRVEHYDINEAM
jgi:hypothetical protein